MSRLLCRDAAPPPRRARSGQSRPAARRYARPAGTAGNAAIRLEPERAEEQQSTPSPSSRRPIPPRLVRPAGDGCGRAYRDRVAAAAAAAAAPSAAVRCSRSFIRAPPRRRRGPVCRHCRCAASQTGRARPARVVGVAKRRPPMTARASAAFCSSPGPPIAIGIMPTIIAVAVISTGRIRVCPAEIAASKALHAGQLLLAREGDEQDRVGRRDADGHDRAHQRGHAEGRIGDVEHRDDAAKGRRQRQDHDKRIAEVLVIDDHQQSRRTQPRTAVRWSCRGRLGSCCRSGRSPGSCCRGRAAS